MEGDNLIFVFAGMDALRLGAYFGVGAASGIGLAFFAAECVVRAYDWTKIKLRKDNP